MGSDWTDRAAVLRDLAIAQGNVPGPIVNAVSSNERPPALHFDEDTEAEFLHPFVGNGDGHTDPDFGLIKEMLNQVRNVRIHEIENPDTVADKKNAEDEDIEAKIIKVNKSRNVAITSILQTINDANEAKADTNLKNNVTGLICMPPENMFKRKTNVEKSIKQKTNICKEKSGESKPNYYVPSSQVAEYYNTFVENTKKEQPQEDIWTKAERQMKEIEAKRKQLNSAS